LFVVSIEGEDETMTSRKFRIGRSNIGAAQVRTGKQVNALVVIGIVIVAVLLVTVSCGKDVVARVNDTEIGRKELDARMKVMGDDEADAEALSRNLDDLVNEAIFAQMAASKDVVVTDEDVEKVLQDYENQVGKESVDQLLQALGVDREGWKQYMKPIVLEREYTNHVTVALKAQGLFTEEDFEAYYQQNMEYFAVDEGVHASHILVETREEAEALLTEIENGAAFAEVARAHSIGPSAVNGGDLSFFSYDQMVEEFSEAAFALEPGEISGIVESEFGFHIIQVHEKREAGYTSFEAARADIEAYLYFEEASKQVDEEFSAYKDTVEVEKLLGD